MIELDEGILSKVITTRPSLSHKGDYGRILLIGGSENYGGAIIMATEGAINAGAGLIAVATHSVNLSALHSRDPEAMFIDWKDKNLARSIQKMDVIVCGPGLGTSGFAKMLLKTLVANVSSDQVVVLDASALDLISQDLSLLPQAKLIFTPHQMEWQRLSQIKIPFQSDTANLVALKNLPNSTDKILVLKSNHTHIYDQSGKIYVNSTGNPGMATGGTGDTLAGIIGGFVAQFGYSMDTVAAAVYLHSLVADEIYRTNYIVRPTAISQKLPQLMKKYSNIK